MDTDKHGFPEAPSTELQHPEKLQISNNSRASSLFWSLKLDVSLVFGCWCLALSSVFICVYLCPSVVKTSLSATTAFANCAFVIVSGGVKLMTLLCSPSGRSEEHTSELQSLRHLVCR